MSDRDLKQYEALEDSGILLRAAVLEQIRKSRWEAGTNVPVSVAPFMRDCVKPEDLNPRSGAVGIQNERLRKKVLVDVIATRASSTTGVLCVGIEKPSQGTRWVFASPYTNYERFFTAYMAVSGPEPGDLLHVPNAGDTGKGLSVRMREYDLPLNPGMYDQGASFKTDGGSGPDSSLADASRRIVEGTCRLVAESLTQHVSSSQDKDAIKDEQFIPIIVTTADIFSCEYSQNDIDVGGVSNPKLVSKDRVVYDCPVPASARFPKQTVSVHEPTSRAARWPVLITSPRGLKEFLGEF